MPTITYGFSNTVEEFVVNATTADDQFRPDVVMLANGEMLFTFDTDSPSNPAFQDVASRRFSATGAPISSIDVTISSGGGTDDEENSAIAILSNGSIVVVNQDDNGGADEDVEFHIHDSAGNGISTQNIITQAEGQASDDQFNPKVAALARGGFVVVYVDQLAGSLSNLNAEFVIFNNAGTFVAHAGAAGGGTTLAVSDPVVAGLANNTFVVAWQEDVGGGDLNIKFRIFNVFGNGGPELTADTESDDQSQPAVAALPGGGFALVFRDEVFGPVNDSELEINFYDASGTQVGPTRFILPTGAELLTEPDIAVISDNLLLVSYTTNRNGIGNEDIYGQLFTLSGNLVGPEFELEVTSGAQRASALASRGGGVFVTTWQDAAVVAGVDVSGLHVAAQVTQVTRSTTGDATSEVLSGDDLRDVIRGDGGNDLIDGGGGDDTALYFGNVASYRFDFVGSDIRIADLRSGAPDGTDTVRRIENLKFANALLAPLYGTGGDDAFVASGDQAISASVGNDTITFNFALTDATISFAGNAVVIEFGTTHTVASGFETFVFTDGSVHTNDGNPLVDDLFYYARHHDVWLAHADADLHYAASGWLERRDPNAFFSTSLYLALNPDVAAAGVDPLAHFDASGWMEGRIPSIAFNAAQYLAANPDVAAAHVDPLAHFLGAGAQEGRVPFAWSELLAADGFDYVYYLQHNPDVAAAGVDPLEHFQTFGWQEGRNPNALFDTSGYLAAYPDVAAAHVNPFDHYNQSGWHEGRDPSVNFDTVAYLAAYPDVAAAGANPLLHYLFSGIHEGRSAFADGVFG